MRDIKIGMTGGLSDLQLNRAGAQEYEQAGYDFMIWADQMSLTIPRSIWTPDLVPAAAVVDVDAYMDPWPLATDAATHTSRMSLGITVCDVVRRLPANYAQLALTLDHFSQGRFFLGLGTGEMRHFTPYGVPRNKPYTHLEETVKIVKLLMESDGPVDYEGPIWNLDRAVMTLAPYGDTIPPVLVAGGGRAATIAGTHADGWITMQPFGSSPEEYASDVIRIKELVEKSGRDPEAFRFYVTAFVLLGSDDAAVDRLVNHPLAKWDSVALITNAEYYRSWEGSEHPIRRDYTYARDMISMNWSHADAWSVIDQVTPGIVRRARACGTPVEVADQLQPYVEAGANWLNIVDYSPLLGGGGQFGETGNAVDLVGATAARLREVNGMTVAAAEGALR
ncbi:LLM class flavin-dependent oxidoreductase [Mycobacterium sp. E1747]|uniref:LLM class flavin-dependent oxidoreductase n=1 Tax=Mycobacterium sp. E1747 TaxID=1834128 RepID=UPI000A8F9572|nr:LLM class flavin-dependent oxidoreductase [Mycobacterium sp. E1747]